MPPDNGRFPLDTNSEPNPTEGSETVLNRVRAMAATWQSLAVGTSATYRHGRLSLFVDIADPRPFFSQSEGRMQTVALACLRVDYLGSAISAAWIASAYSGDADIDITQADPHDSLAVPVDPPGSVNGLDEVIAWLEAQLRRPIQRVEWTKGGETVARLWMLADTGRQLVVSGPREIRRDPRTADSVIQIRP